MQIVTDPMTLPEIWNQAAVLIDENGLNCDDWWENPLRQPWQPGKALCVAAAIGVATGRTTYGQMTADIVHQVESADVDDEDPDLDRTDMVQVLHPAVEGFIAFLPGITTPEQLFAWSEAEARANRSWVVSEALRRCAAEHTATVGVA